MRTDFCDLIGLELPIVQSAIGGATTPELAAAVSNAGGLGALACTGLGAEDTAQAIAAIRASTDHPFAANLLIPYGPDAEFHAALKAGAPLIWLFWGDPTPYIRVAHDAGAGVMLTVGSVEEAKSAAAAGVDIVVAQGSEAGGHVRGELSTMALVPAVVDALPGVPVLAAGGIADGRGVAAALMLGAGAAVLGTAFLSAEEANVHPTYRAEVQAASGADTRHSTLYNVGWPGAAGRTLVNSTWRAWEAAGRPAPGVRPGDGEIIARETDGAGIERYQATTARAELTGNIEAMPLWAGQGVGLVTQTRPAAQIVADLASGAQSAMARLQTR